MLACRILGRWVQQVIRKVEEEELQREVDSVLHPRMPRGVPSQLRLGATARGARNQLSLLCQWCPGCREPKVLGCV